MEIIYVLLWILSGYLVAGWENYFWTANAKLAHKVGESEPFVMLALLFPPLILIVSILSRLTTARDWKSWGWRSPFKTWTQEEYDQVRKDFREKLHKELD